jgi:aspartyl/asparaginyl-tRNA synthetase
MDMSNKTVQPPKWFQGMIYEEGAIATNPFTKQEYELSNVELSVYDFITGTQYLMEAAPKSITSKEINLFHKALSWFRKNNPEAYMILLD